ncbi:sugar phosphate isomerase/epimerase family protein [Egibacter rhizosphaerae]|nr:sugar phosphate isomerase/epimerase [Egibacter rhizosphaerae]
MHGEPRILASTAPLLLSPVNWVLDAFADAGFTEAELLLARHPDSREPDRILARAQEAGLRIPVVHGPYMLLLRNVLGRAYIEKTRRSLEIARAVGAQTLVAHAPFRWERRARGWLAAEADDEAAEIGPSFAMENLYPVAGRNFSSVVTPQDLAPFRHVVFDTSHFAVAGIDLFDAWDAIGHQVVHLHVSDNHGAGKDNHAPIGTGTLPLAAFLAHVGRSGYSGTVTLELDCRPHLDARSELVAFWTRQRQLAEALLAGEAAPDNDGPEHAERLAGDGHPTTDAGRATQQTPGRPLIGDAQAKQGGRHE